MAIVVLIFFQCRVIFSSFIVMGMSFFFFLDECVGAFWLNTMFWFLSSFFVPTYELLKLPSPYKAVMEQSYIGPSKQNVCVLNSYILDLFKLRQCPGVLFFLIRCDSLYNLY